MTRKQRLLNALFEIEQQLDALVVELENLTIKKKAQAKSAETVALYNWINTEFFTLSDDLSDYAYTSYSKGISTLRRIIEYAELKEPVKVVHQLNAEREVFESFLEKSEFEKVKGFYVQCPVCGTQVGKRLTSAVVVITSESMNGSQSLQNLTVALSVTSEASMALTMRL